MFAAIEKYRVPAQILLGTIAVSFIGFGLAQFDFSPNSQYIVKIGDQIITRHQIDDLARNQKQVNRESLLRELMNQAYLVEGAKQLGIHVSEQQIKQAIVDTKEFHDSDGKFSTEIFNQVLSSNGLTEQRLSDMMRENLTLQALDKILQSNVVSDQQVQRLMAARTATRSLRSVGLNPQAFENKVDVSEANLKKFYDSNTQTYTLPQAVKFEFVKFSPKTLAEKETVSDEELKQAEKNSQDNPQIKREIAHILIEFGSDKNKAKTQAEDIAKQAQAHPEKFGELAKQYSQDPDSKDKNGVMGEFSAKGSLISTAFKDAAFALKSGAVSGVVESEFGYHIIQAKDVGNPEDKINSLRQSIQEKKAQTAYTALREKFSDEAFADPSSLKKAAEKLGLTVQTHSEWLTRANAPAAKIPNQVVEALFSQEVFQQKHNSEAIVVDGETWFVRATETRNEAAQALKDITEQVKTDFVRQESRRLAKAAAQKILEELQAGKEVQLAWSPVQDLTPEQMQGNLSMEAFRAVLNAAPKNGKPAYVLVDNLGAPQIVEIQKINPLNNVDKQAVDTVKQVLMPSAMSLQLREAYLDSLTKSVKTQQGSETLQDAE